MVLSGCATPGKLNGNRTRARPLANALSTELRSNRLECDIWELSLVPSISVRYEDINVTY